MATKGQFYIPSFQQGWGGAFYGTKYLAGFSFDLSDGILYTIYPQQQYDVFLNATTTLAQGLSVANKQLGGSYQNPKLPDPDLIFTQQIFNPPVPSQAGIATESGNQITTESSDSLVTNQQVDNNIFPPEGQWFLPRCLLTEIGAPLLTESESYLVL